MLNLSEINARFPIVKIPATGCLIRIYTYKLFVCLRDTKSSENVADFAHLETILKNQNLKYGEITGATKLGNSCCPWYGPRNICLPVCFQKT